MVEYAIYFQIVEHFSNNNLFHPNHHGSLTHHSTATAIIQLFDMWLEAADNQELSAACLLDQSAAYDLLKGKLKLYNFDESSISWIMSYLGCRTQQVQVEPKKSNALDRLLFSPRTHRYCPQEIQISGRKYPINLFE